MSAALDIFIDKLEDIESVEAGHVLVSKTLADLGFERFAYLGLHLPDASLVEPVLLHSYADEWQDLYVNGNYAAVDPVVEKGLATVVPFSWGGDKQRKSWAKNSRKMMDEASDFGLSCGFTVPIHGARGELAALTIAVDENPIESHKRIEAYRYDLHLMALYFHAKMGEQILSESQSVKFSLSNREGECLLWVSQGKTAWEIGEILKISEHTVRDYIKNSCHKLGVYSKSHAVVKAIMLGLIKPNL